MLRLPEAASSGRRRSPAAQLINDASTRRKLSTSSEGMSECVIVQYASLDHESRREVQAQQTQAFLSSGSLGKPRNLTLVTRLSRFLLHGICQILCHELQSASSWWAVPYACGELYAIQEFAIVLGRCDQWR